MLNYIYGQIYLICYYKFKLSICTPRNFVEITNLIFWHYCRIVSSWTCNIAAGEWPESAARPAHFTGQWRFCRSYHQSVHSKISSCLHSFPVDLYYMICAVYSACSAVELYANIEIKQYLWFRKHTTYRTRRKIEIKNLWFRFPTSSSCKIISVLLFSKV